MHTLSKILDRIISTEGLKNDADLAKLFNVAASTVSSWRTRDSIPYEKIIAFCVSKNISLNHIFLGEGPEYKMNFQSEFDVDEDIKTYGNLSQEENELIKALRELDPLGRKGVYISAVGQCNEAMRERTIRKDKRKKEILEKTIKILTKAIGEM